MAAVAELAADLKVPPFPAALSYLWKAYLRLRRRKSVGFSAHNKIEWPDILAFVALTRTRLAPWEVALIEDLDDIFLRAQDEAREGTAAEQSAAARDGLALAAKRHVVAR